MKPSIVAALFVGLTSPTPTTAAWFNTEQLLAVCESGLQNPVPDNPRFALCTGLIIGVLTADVMEKDVICLPIDTDTKAAIRVFVARAAAEPDKHIDGVVTLYRALAEQYPCKAK